MPPAVATYYHTFPSLIRSLSSNDDAETKRSISISLGLLFGVGVLALILVVFCCVRQSRPSPDQEQLFGGERDAVSVEILRGAKDMPYLKGFRNGDRAGGCCGLLCMGCCGVANESAVTVERRGRDVVLCAGPSGSYGSVPGRGSHHPDRNHGLGGNGRGPSGRGRDSSGESHRHRDNNQPPAPTPASGHRGGSSGRGSRETPGSGSGGGGGARGGAKGGARGGARGRARGRGRTPSGGSGGGAGNANIITHGGRNTSTHIGLPSILPTDRPGRSAHQHPPSSHHRPHSFDGPYLGHTRWTKTPPSRPSRERGRPRSFSPAVRRQHGGRSPPRTEIEPIVSYPEAVYQGSGRRASSGQSEHEIPRPQAREISLNPWDFYFVGAPIPADLLLPEYGSSAISTAHILGRSREGSGAGKASGSRMEDRTGDGTPRVISVHPSDSRNKPEHLGLLVDPTVSMSTSGGSVLPSSSSSRLGTDSSTGTIRKNILGTPGVSTARSYQYRTSSGSTETIMYAPLAEITGSHSASSENHASSATAPSLSTAKSTTSQKSHSSSVPKSRLPGQSSTTSHLPPPPSSRSRPASTYTTPPHSNLPAQPPSLPGLQQSYYTTAPSSVYSNTASAPGWVPAIVVVPRAVCVDRRYWTTVESVSDSDE